MHITKIGYNHNQGGGGACAVVFGIFLGDSGIHCMEPSAFITVMRLLSLCRPRRGIGLEVTRVRREIGLEKLCHCAWVLEQMPNTLRRARCPWVDNNVQIMKKKK